MNVIIITIALIILCIVITIQYAKNVKLAKQNEMLAEKKNTIEQERLAIIKITKSLLYNLLDRSNLLPNNEIPFARIITNPPSKETLDSIRLRLKDGKVLIYINGTINPTTDMIALNNITSFKQEHFDLIYALFYKLKEMDKSPIIKEISPNQITNNLIYTK